MKKTGVSVFYVDEGIDSGPIISQIEVSIDNKSQRDLIEITKKIGMEAISKSIIKFIKIMLIIPNDSSKMTYYSFPTKKMLLILRRKIKIFLMNILTFDIEEWFHILDNNHTNSVDKWSFESRIKNNMEIIHTILNENKLSATFFVVGWIVEKYPKLIKEISNLGYEVGSHTTYIN